MAIDLLGGVLTGATLEVRSNVAPPLSLALDPAPGAPGWLLRALQPQVTLKRGGQVITTAAPYGAPGELTWLVIAAGLLVVVGLILMAVGGGA